MALSNQDLLSISQMLDAKLLPIENRLKSTEQLINTKLLPIENRLKSMEQLISTKLPPIENRLKNIDLLLENDVLPRLQNIESCYTSTYRKYASSAEQLDALQTDVDIIKKVVTDHSKKLQKIS